MEVLRTTRELKETGNRVTFTSRAGFPYTLAHAWKGELISEENVIRFYIDGEAVLTIYETAFESGIRLHVDKEE